MGGGKTLLEHGSVAGYWPTRDLTCVALTQIRPLLIKSAKNSGQHLWPVTPYPHPDKPRRKALMEIERRGHAKKLRLNLVPFMHGISRQSPAVPNRSACGSPLRVNRQRLRPPGWI